jgi:hypothetical protein
MAVIKTEVREDGVGHAVEVLISADLERGGEDAIEIVVPQDSPALFLVAFDDEIPTLQSGPGREKVRIDVRPPEGAIVDGKITYTDSGIGMLAVEQPPPGRWRIALVYQPGASALVSVTAFAPKFWLKLKRLGRRFRCKTCHVFLKPLVVTALVTLVMNAAPSALVVALGLKVKAILGLTLGEGAIEKLLKILTGYTGKPIEWFIREACRLVGLCE